MRQLLNSPGFTAVVTFTLALGIGATTIVFSIVNGVLLEPLDYPGYERIVHIWESDPSYGIERRNTSPANFVDWREQSTVFDSIAFSAEHSGMETRSFIYTEDGLALNLRGRFVSTGYFAVYGLQPLLGRSFLPEEEERGAPRVTVISHRLWGQLYDYDPEAIGKGIVLENAGRHTYEIVGIMPEGSRVQGADVWVPCGHMPHPMTRRGRPLIHVVGRLKEGVSIERARAELEGIQGGIYATHGDLNRSDQYRTITSTVDLAPTLDLMVGSTRPSLFLFSGAVALVLLIACANVANLLLSRNLARRGEIAVRLSLGASRWRIIRQLLSESIVLSLIGGTFGVLLAYWGTGVITKLNAGNIPRVEAVGIDGMVLVFALSISVITGILFGLAPALQCSKTDLSDSLKDNATRSSAGVSQQRLRGMFTVAQVALALMLLLGAGLLLKSFDHLQKVETGFDTEELLTVEFTMTGAGYPELEDRRRFLRRLMEEMRGVPGVEAACAVSQVPDRGKGWPTQYARLDLPQPPRNEWSIVSVRVATPDYLKTYGIKLLQGREFAESDTANAARVVIDHQPVDDQIDGVLLLLVELGQHTVELHRLAVDAGAHEPFARHLR